MLDWGLGHATRSIPIIDCLLLHGNEIIIGSNGRALFLLKENYPNLKFFELPDYNIKYFTQNMLVNMAFQWYKMPFAIWKEHNLIGKIIQKNDVDLIISDNRYGCYQSKIPSVIITHQLNIKSGHKITDFMVQKINHYWLKNFNQIWIPDLPNSEISGDLSKNAKFENIFFLGPISRMKYQKRPFKRDLIVILSGPEPQRTHFETKIIQQIAKTDYSALIVGGKTESFYKQQLSENIDYISFLGRNALNDAILASQYVIARSGYTTLLDLYVLGKKALLIPTPGQTEQEYLAQNLMKKKIFPFQNQGEINIKQALDEMDSFSGFTPILKDNLCERLLELNSLDDNLNV